MPERFEPFAVSIDSPSIECRNRVNHQRSRVLYWHSPVNEEPSAALDHRLRRCGRIGKGPVEVAEATVVVHRLTRRVCSAIFCVGNRHPATLAARCAWFEHHDPGIRTNLAESWRVRPGAAWPWTPPAGDRLTHGATGGTRIFSRSVRNPPGAAAEDGGRDWVLAKSCLGFAPNTGHLDCSYRGWRRSCWRSRT